MSFSLDDTIAAPASAAGHGLRGVIRISGPDAKSSLDGWFEPNDTASWIEAKLPRRHAGILRLTQLQSPLPVAVHLWPTHRSYTAQPTAEIHLPGAPPLIEATLADLYAHGARPAKPGEFTLRAFLAGRIDLMQAEAVLGVIDADEQAALKQALDQLAGGISGRIAEVHRDLLELLADLEAGLDFVEEDIEFVSQEEIARRIRESRSTVATILRQSSDRMESTGTIRVVLAGLPNAGKSTLFNALIGDEAAIVSEQVGTTRDAVRAEIELDGVTVELFDTAGWESTTEGIAGIAQQMRSDVIQRADLILWCRPIDLSDEDAHTNACVFAELPAGVQVIVVVTKSDFAPPDSGDFRKSPESSCTVSAHSGSGLTLLKTTIQNAVVNDASADGLIATTAARCRGSLESAIRSLGLAADAQSALLGDDIVAAEVRDALNHLGEIVGVIYTDDLLDRIFSKFCIGK